METKDKRRTPAKRRRPAQKRPAAPTGRPARNAAAANQRRRRPSAARKTPPPQKRVRRYDPDRPRVVYTPPKPLSRNMLLMRLVTVVAVVLAVTTGMSIFFKVETITVSGAVKYDPWAIKEASGIQIGDGLLTFGETKAAAKIKTLPYVDQVRIGIKLPDTVNIEIKEFDIFYSVRDAADNWWLITSGGTVMEKVDRATADGCTKILGVRLGNPIPGQQAVAQEEEVQAPAEDSTETTEQTVTRASDRLAAALDIAGYLEGCGILGDVASVDVEDLANIELMYGTRFRVKLGDTGRLEYKIRCMNAAINGKDPLNSLKEHDSGTLDVSFTIKEDQLIYQSTTE